MPLPGQVAPYVCQLRIAVWSALSPHMELLHATDLLPMQGFFFCDFASLSLPLSLPLSPSLSPSFSLSLPLSLYSIFYPISFSSPGYYFAKVLLTRRVFLRALLLMQL